MDAKMRRQGIGDMAAYAHGRPYKATDRIGVAVSLTRWMTVGAHLVPRGGDKAAVNPHVGAHPAARLATLLVAPAFCTRANRERLGDHTFQHADVANEAARVDVLVCSERGANVRSAG